MTEIPANQDINVSDGCLRNMKHVVFEPRSKNASFQILCSQSQRLWSYRQNFCVETEQICIDIADWLRRVPHFRSRHVGKHRSKLVIFKVLHEPFRPKPEFTVETPSKHGRVNINPKNFLSPYFTPRKETCLASLLPGGEPPEPKDIKKPSSYQIPMLLQPMGYQKTQIRFKMQQNGEPVRMGSGLIRDILKIFGNLTGTFL